MSTTLYIPEVTIIDVDAAEDGLLRLLRGANDLSIASEELARSIRDDYTKHHLSAARADLLRPFAHVLANGRVLEIGAGCGALTRFLGETSVYTTAVESDPARAAMAAERCRDLRNVRVVCERWGDCGFPTQSFDVIVCVLDTQTTLFPVGKYHHDRAELMAALLQRCRKWLHPDGVLIVAGYNRLGMMGEAGVAINDDNKEAAFTKNEWRTILAAGGFAQPEWLFPFPDHLFPLSILREKAFTTPGFNAADLVDHNLADLLIENKLITELANSFLVVAGKALDDNILAYTYGASRRPSYRKSNVFRQVKEGITVCKEALFPDLTRDHCIGQTLSDEIYSNGNLYSNELARLMTAPGWTIEDVFAWAHPWYCFLNEHAYATDEGKLLDGMWLDAAPFNLVKDPDGRLTVIDLEWIADTPLPLHYVFFRGLYHCLLRIGSFNIPLVNSSISAFELITEVLESFERNRCDAAARFIELETRHFRQVVQGEMTIRDFPLYDVNGPGYAALQSIDLEVFVETTCSSFTADNCSRTGVLLQAEKKVYTIPLPEVHGPLLKIRIDPGEREGTLQLFFVDLWRGEKRLFRKEASAAELVDVSVMGTTLLLHSKDPMLIFSIPEAFESDPEVPFFLRVGLSMSDKK